jgi:pimeloyl-ACP methyl ester carboxylesterase
MNKKFRAGLPVAFATILLASCGGSNDDPPQLTQATPAVRQACATLASGFRFASTTITAASIVPAGTVTAAGPPVGEHCLVSGAMNQRTGVNGNYAIGFEMRLPAMWNGRFFYQANGGSDGAILPAVGTPIGGGALTNALQMGFAVISSDAGHTAAQNAPGPTNFGLDPKARLEYGYQAVGALTPMARSLVQSAYGKAPDRMYIGGCSNGGRHAMVAAARYPEQYDGYLVGSPGFNLPRSGVQEMWDTQQLATVATGTTTTGLPDVSTAFTTAERALMSSRIVQKCDALDGATDGMVLDVKACQSAFNVNVDVPTCLGARDGTCLTSAQKTALSRIYGGARNSAGAPLYATFPWDRGIFNGDWAHWKYVLNTSLGATAVPYIFVTPPVQVTSAELLNFVLNFNMDVDAPKIFATSGAFTESSMSFMTPPNPTNLAVLRNRGAKMIVTHGTADPVFSSDDTASWYDGLRAATGADTSKFVRYFQVPGMGHCFGGAATDQFDALMALVQWVENGTAPGSLTATVRGTGNPGGVNSDVPASWLPSRSRPLCPYPSVARLKAGATDLESASSFTCQ